MTVNNKDGLKSNNAARVNEQQIRQLKKDSGLPVIGYLCCFAPPEIISTSGAIPYRITGIPGIDNSEADAYVEPYGCTYVRNILARATRGEFNFLDGLIISHSCDMVQRLYGIWTYYHPLPYSYMFNVPHQVSPWGRDFFERELGFFQESLENFTGNTVTEEKLKKTIFLFNKNRALIRQIYNLRKSNPPPVRGSEMLDLLIMGGTLPAKDFNILLNNKLSEAEKRSTDSSNGPRILVWGSIMDDPALLKMIEEAGGHIVTDDTCIGFRVWDNDVPETDNPYLGLTEHYFLNFQCPRTDRGPGIERFEYLLQRAREYKVDAVIGYAISFCDPHKFDYPDLRDYLKKEGLPLLLIDDNYSFEPAESIKTRIQAFLEII
ncbi:MAG: 2-hydroxyacyl-CoA dehydratase subunit D [Bacillota bacterium]